MLKGFRRKYKALEVLSEEELEAIHRGALESAGEASRLSGL